MNKSELRKIIQETDSRSGKIFDLTVQLLIFISITALSLETVPELAIYKQSFSVLESLLLCLFILEYILRLYVAEKRKEFVFSFYGLIDLIAIMPSLITLGLIDFRFLRAFRFIRVFRILKLARYNSAIARMKNAFIEIKDELVIFSFMTIIILYISAAGIYYFENPAQPENFKSIFHSLWWSVATLTTVGYGDIYPVTVGGRIFTFVILMVGLGIVSVPSALLASAFSKNK